MSSPAIILMFFGLTALVAAGRSYRGLLQERKLDLRVLRYTGTSSRDREAWKLPAFLVPKRENLTDIEAKLRLAGFTNAQAAQWFSLIRASATVISLTSTAIIIKVTTGGYFTQPLFFMIFGGLGFMFPKFALTTLMKKRTQKVTAEFPFFLDLVLMMLQSGVSIDQCFRTIARNEAVATPLISQEVSLMVADLDRGLSYEIALDRWATRVAINGTRELSAIFRQAIFQGIELAPALREFSVEFTQRRVAAAKEAMGKITVRMVMFMTIFFMPALFIVLGGPPVASVFDTLGQAAQK